MLSWSNTIDANQLLSVETLEAAEQRYITAVNRGVPIWWQLVMFEPVPADQHLTKEETR